MAKAIPFFVILNTYMSNFNYFMRYSAEYLKRQNPIKNFIAGIIGYYKEVTTLKQRVNDLDKRILIETYKLKKTQLILNQNSETYNLKGSSLNQLR